MLQCLARAHGVWASPARLEWYSKGLPAPPASPVFLSKLARVDLGDFGPAIGSICVPTCVDILDFNKHVSSLSCP